MYTCSSSNVFDILNQEIYACVILIGTRKIAYFVSYLSKILACFLKNGKKMWQQLKSTTLTSSILSNLTILKNTNITVLLTFVNVVKLHYRHLVYIATKLVHQVANQLNVHFMLFPKVLFLLILISNFQEKFSPKAICICLID